MHDERTATLRLPLPHPDNALDEDVERLRAALTALDTESGNVRALFATLSGLLESAAGTAAWAGVSGKPEAFPPAPTRPAMSRAGPTRSPRRTSERSPREATSLRGITHWRVMLG